MTEVEEILTLRSVDIFQLCYNRNDNKYDLISVIKSSPFRVFREVIVTNEPQRELTRELTQRLALIKCNDWFYPLESGKTFVYRSRDRQLCYVFPDPSVEDCISVVVISGAVDDVKLILFENVLILYATLEDLPQEWKPIIDQLMTTNAQPFRPEVIPTVETSDLPSSGSQTGTAQMLAKNIVYGAEMINNGITYGTQVVNNLLKRGSAHIKANQSHETQQNVNIDPRVISGLRGLRTASHTASAVTGYAVNAVAKGTNKLSHCLAPHVRRHSTKLISNVSGKSEGESGKICEDILTVASGGLQGFSTLYNGVTENAITLAKTVGNETVEIVNNRYGSQAGRATEEALYTAGNAAVTVQNFNHLGPKAIAKKVALDTGKTTITQHINKEESQRKT